MQLFLLPNRLVHLGVSLCLLQRPLHLDLDLLALPDSTPHRPPPWTGSPAGYPPACQAGPRQPSPVHWSGSVWPSPHRLPGWVFWPRRGRGQGDERCGHHGAGYSTNEEAEGLRGGLPADHGPVNKPVSLVPVDGRPGYFKLVDLPDLFPVLPASAATLLRDVTVEEAVSLFHKFVSKNFTEDLVVRILGPMFR